MQPPRLRKTNGWRTSTNVSKICCGRVREDFLFNRFEENESMFVCFQVARNRSENMPPFGFPMMKPNCACTVTNLNLLSSIDDIIVESAEPSFAAPAPIRNTCCRYKAQNRCVSVWPVMMFWRKPEVKIHPILQSVVRWYSDYPDDKRLFIYRAFFIYLTFILCFFWYAIRRHQWRFFRGRRFGWRR